MVAYLANSFDANLADTRRAMRVVFFMRSSFALFAWPPHFVAPKIDEMSQEALGPIADKWGYGSDNVTPAAEGSGVAHG